MTPDESSHSMPPFLNFFLTRVRQKDTILTHRILPQTLSEARWISYEIMTNGNAPSNLGWLVEILHFPGHAKDVESEPGLGSLPVHAKGL